MAKPGNRTITGYCPSCDTQIRFKRRPHRGQLVTCPECEDLLEVFQESPLKLDWAFEEVWDDDETQGKSRDLRDQAKRGQDVDFEYIEIND